MTKEEQILNGFTEMMKGFWNNQDLKVPDIKTLKSKTKLEEHTTCKQESCEDTISRQAAIDVVKKWFDKIYLNSDICLDGIRSLPSVTPQQKVGKWMIHPNGVYAHLICSKCLTNAPYDCKTNYCPNCGAKMEVE